MIAVNAAPGSCPGSISSPTTRTCALEETGRNSVRAWTRPRTTASMNDMGSPRTTRDQAGPRHRPQAPHRVRGAGRGPGAAQRSSGEEYVEVPGRAPARRGLSGRSRLRRPRPRRPRRRIRRPRRRSRRDRRSRRPRRHRRRHRRRRSAAWRSRRRRRGRRRRRRRPWRAAPWPHRERGRRHRGRRRPPRSDVRRRRSAQQEWSEDPSSCLDGTSSGGTRHSGTGLLVARIPVTAAIASPRRSSSPGGQVDPTPHRSRRRCPARQRSASVARSPRRARSTRGGLRVPDPDRAARHLDRAGAGGAGGAGGVRALGACAHPPVCRRGSEGLVAATQHPGAVHAVARTRTAGPHRRRRTPVHNGAPMRPRPGRFWSNGGVPEISPFLVGVLLVAYLPPAVVLSWVDGAEHRLPNRWVGALTAAVGAALLVLGMLLPPLREDLRVAAVLAIVLGLGAIVVALFAPMVLGMGDAKTLPVVVLMSGSFGGEVLIAALLGVALLSGALGVLVMAVTRRSGVRFALGPVLLSGPFLGLLGAPLVRAALGGL